MACRKCESEDCVTGQCDSEDSVLTLEDALEKTGNGLYNILLVLTCSIILLAIGMDILGLNLVVAAACDLNLGVMEQGILTSLPFIGIFLVSYFWGYVSDTRGRRFTLVLPLMMSFICSIIASFSTNWLFLGIMKFLGVCFGCAANSVTYTLVGESCVQRVRNRYMVMMTTLLILSPAAAAAVTYPTLKLDFATEIVGLGIKYRPWRLLIVALAIPFAIGALAIYFFKESPKFLFNSGRHEEALEVLRYIYAVNHRGSKKAFPVRSLVLNEQREKKKMSVFKAVYEQSAPLFRKPYLFRSLQLYYIVAVAYITNNSFLVWLPYILNTVLTSEKTGNVCHLISSRPSVVASNTTIVEVSKQFSGELCESKVEENVIFTMITSQLLFATLNFILSCFPNRRRVVVVMVLLISSTSGVLMNISPEPVSSVAFYIAFTCPCLSMGILASYFVSSYPTAYRGMAACLSIMVGRSVTFFGVNFVGSVIFSYCEIIFYAWAVLVFSSAVAAWFLPPDQPSIPTVPTISSVVSTMPSSLITISSVVASVAAKKTERSAL